VRFQENRDKWKEIVRREMREEYRRDTSWGLVTETPVVAALHVTLIGST